MKIYQNKAGVYLPDECQPVSNKWQKYRPHESVRYVFVKDSEMRKSYRNYTQSVKNVVDAVHVMRCVP